MEMTLHGIHVCCPESEKAIAALAKDAKVTFEGTGPVKSAKFVGKKIDGNKLMADLRVAGFNCSVDKSPRPEYISRPVPGVKGVIVRFLPDFGDIGKPGSDAGPLPYLISKTGTYEVDVGDLIELACHYKPDKKPQKVDVKVSDSGVLSPSAGGVRREVLADTVIIGAQETISFLFSADKPGQDTVTILIDGKEHVYKFKVSQSK
jgi:hypothetical protein